MPSHVKKEQARKAFKGRECFFRFAWGSTHIYQEEPHFRHVTDQSRHT